MPSGDFMLWQDQENCFHALSYSSDRWDEDKEKSVITVPLCNGSLTTTPNGLGLIHWQANTVGVTVHLYGGRETSHQLENFKFLSTPSSVPDGKGLVGLIKAPTGQVLVYTPIQVPLADVINAPLFVNDTGIATRLSKYSGIFKTTNYDQMFTLYETELYDGGSNSGVQMGSEYDGLYSKTSFSRPYLVTTDVFWEIFAAAYEGLFLLQEKQRAIPAFWEFVMAADRYYQKHNTDDNWPWVGVFAVLREFHHPSHSKPELADYVPAEIQRIQAQTDTFSPLFCQEAYYSELKPRSHYTASSELQAYFKAVKYLTEVAVAGSELPACLPYPQAVLAKITSLKSLQNLPNDIQAKAQIWIDNYLQFIAPPRHPGVWQDSAAFTLPGYVRPHSLKQKPQLFPLAWGFDNEVLNTTVYHSDWPPSEQILDRYGKPRLLPSGLEVAAALGNSTAMQALQEEFARYPNLKPVMESLRARSQAAKSGSKDLYQRWLTALALQWADNISAPQFDSKLWYAKRLQTGLASWATLRHITLLVNERSSAEAGEGDTFEEIVMRPPRGYVEPDPATFRAIAELFEATSRVVAQVLSDPKLRKGVQSRLAESAVTAYTAFMTKYMIT